MTSFFFNFKTLFFYTNNYFLLWTLGVTINLLRWSEIVITGLIVYNITNSAFHVSLLMILRFSPLFIFSVYSGIVADKYNKKFVLLIITLIFIILLIIIYFSLLYINHLYLIQFFSFICGLFWSFESTIRKSLILESTSQKLYNYSLNFDNITLNLTRITGPLLSSLLIDYYKLEYLFTFSIILYTFCIILIFLLKTDYKNKLSNSKLNYSPFHLFTIISKNKRLQSTYLITILFNLFAYSYISLLPAIVNLFDHLHFLHLNYLFSIEALGSLFGLILILIYDKQKLFFLYYLFGTFLTLICSLIFCFYFNIYYSFFVLFFSGLGAGLFGSMQSVLIALYSPARYKGSLLGVLNICIGFASLGYLHIGVLTHYFSIINSIYITSIEGLLFFLLILIFYKKHIFHS